MMTTLLAQCDTATVARVLRRLHGSTRAADPVEEPPLLGAVLDDLESVLGEYARPTVEDIPALEVRLCGALQQFVAMAGQIREPIDAGLTERVQRLTTEADSGDYARGLGYVRRLALTVQDLLDHCCVGYPPSRSP